MTVISEYEWKDIFSERFSSLFKEYEKRAFGMLLTPSLILMEIVAKQANNAWNSPESPNRQQAIDAAEQYWFFMLGSE